jgi:DNA-binding NarL/FixJ family response regulator
MIRTVIISGGGAERYTKFIASQPGISVLGQGRDGYDALKIAARIKPDVVLIDEILPLVDVAELTRILKCRLPKMRIIILASAHDNIRILKAISCGASGYLLKNIHEERFVAGIKTVYDGGCLMTQETAAKAFRLFPPNAPAKAASPSARKEAPLTPYANISRQELRIIVYINKGFSNREISERLGLKEGTVRNYITSIFKKTGLKNRTQIAVYAGKAGLVKEPHEDKLFG